MLADDVPSMNRHIKTKNHIPVFIAPMECIRGIFLAYIREAFTKLVAGWMSSNISKFEEFSDCKACISATHSGQVLSKIGSVVWEL